MAGWRSSAPATASSGTLSDDVLTQEPRSPSVRAYLREGVDRLAGADPGLTQLRTALQAVASIAVAVGLVRVFVALTGALQLPASSGPAAVVSADNHGLLVVSMLLAGMIAMLTGFTVADSTARGQFISTLILPGPMLATMAAGLALGSWRVPSLVFLVLLMTAAAYVRRFGPRGFAAGLVAFNGGFLGFFLHSNLALADLGWLAADLGLGVFASLLVRFSFFRVDARRTLDRMRRSWDARARRLIRLCLAVLDATEPRHRDALLERLRRQAVRLNESTLMIDAQLVQADSLSAGARAQPLFDAELALSSCARFAGALARTCADVAVRAQARAALAAALDRGDPHAARGLASLAGDTARTTVLAHRLGACIEQYLLARRQLADALLGPVPADPATTFTPAVELSAGFLPGSTPVSATASTTPGRGGPLDRASMAPHVRASVQVAVAATIAVAVGDVVSGPRLYWAVLATFLAFMATTNSGEQVRKALFRVTGTAIGIVAGDLLVHVTGGRVWISLIIVLIALFFGIYLIRVNYTFMVIGITVTVTQLYAQLGEFSWQLLLLRLGETAIGVAAVVVTVLVILPLRPQRVLTAGVLLWFRALTGLLDGALHRLLSGEPASLRPDVRQLDAAYAALEATAAPLRSTTFGRNAAQLSEIRAVTAAARNYARSFATQAEATEPADRLDSPALRAAARQLRGSIAAIDRRIATGKDGSYTRASALLEVAARPLAPGDTPARLALRDLTLLDGSLARLAAALQMELRDHDTTDT